MDLFLFSGEVETSTLLGPLERANLNPVQKPRNSEYYTPSSESSRIYKISCFMICIVYSDILEQDEVGGTKHTWGVPNFGWETRRERGHLEDQGVDKIHIWILDFQGFCSLER
jgi:hypothetical protein